MLAPKILTVVAIVTVAARAQAQDEELPEGYCDVEFNEIGELSASVQGEEGNFIQANLQAPANFGAFSPSNEEFQAYLQDRLMSGAVFLALFALGLLATLPVCCSRLCCVMKCCKPSATKAPTQRQKVYPTVAVAVFGALMLAFAGVGINYAVGINTSASLAACEAVNLTDNVENIFDELSGGGIFDGVRKFIADVRERLEGADDVDTTFDAFKASLEQFLTDVENTPSSVNGFATPRDSLVSSTNGAKTALDASRTALDEVLELRDRVDELLVDGGDALDDATKPLRELEAPAQLDIVEPFIVQNVIPRQAQFVAGSTALFSVSFVVIGLSIAAAVLLWKAEARRATRAVSYTGVSLQWVFMLLGFFLGGLLLLFPFILADVCVLANDFEARPDAYLDGVLPAQIIDVVDGCLAEPSVSIIETLGLKDQVSLKDRIGFDDLDDLNAEEVANLDDFRTLKTTIDELTVQDFGINITREELIARCCDETSTCPPADDINDCSIAQPILEANETAVETIQSLQANISAVATDADAFETAVEELIDSLSEIRLDATPILDALDKIAEITDCGFVGDAYRGVRSALCDVLVPSIYWVAISLGVGAAMGVGMITALLIIAKQSLNAWVAEEAHYAGDAEGVYDDDEFDGAGYGKGGAEEGGKDKPLYSPRVAPAGPPPAVGFGGASLPPSSRHREPPPYANVAAAEPGASTEAPASAAARESGERGLNA